MSDLVLSDGTILGQTGPLGYQEGHPEQAKLLPRFGSTNDGVCDPEYDINCVSGSCVDGYSYDALSGFCELDFNNHPTNPGQGGTNNNNGSSTTQQGNVTVVVNNTVNAVSTAVDSVASAVNNAITSAAQNASDIATRAADTVASGISRIADNIWNGIKDAFGNIGGIIASIVGDVWTNLKSIVGSIVDNIGTILGQIKDFLGPIIKSVSDVVDTIAKEVKDINDTLIQPIANIYNVTIKTITTLTTAIEQDLHEGLGGLLKIPTQLADQLGSFDATLQRTVEQLGSANAATSKSTITFAGETLPKPFGDAISKALAGSTLSNYLTTTYHGSDALSSESLQQVSAEGIRALGTLLSELLGITVEAFKAPFENLHSNWSSVGGVFVGLLDGALSLITTLTAIGAITEPLIEAAGEEARTLIPVVKLDPATTIAAMRRGFITTADGLTEIRKHGIDATRAKVLTDLDTFLADINVALDWWYRGIINDKDLDDNLKGHGVTPDDAKALIAGAINLPALTDLQRWRDFGIINDAEFVQNAKVLRYNDQQIAATLATYQARETPQTRAQLNGLLENSNAGWLSRTLSTEVPEAVALAGARAGYHPDLIRYIWLAHYQLPSVQSFVQAYFRGYRTRTELEQRLAIENIPRELWDETINVFRPLIPYRSIPGLVTKGIMTETRAFDELAAHGYDLEHQQLIMRAVKPVVSTTTTKAVDTVHTLSLNNAKTLWLDDALTAAQYTEILIAHGYTAALADAQMKADLITQHIHTQKATLADYTAQVETGVMTMEDASNALLQGGFSQAQVSKFQIAIVKSQKINSKHPSLGELKTFIKAQIISIDDFKNELQAQGWTEPWLSAFVTLETPPPATA